MCSSRPSSGFRWLWLLPWAWLLLAGSATAQDAGQGSATSVPPGSSTSGLFPSQPSARIDSADPLTILEQESELSVQDWIRQSQELGQARRELDAWQRLYDKSLESFGDSERSRLAERAAVDILIQEADRRASRAEAEARGWRVAGIAGLAAGIVGAAWAIIASR